MTKPIPILYPAGTPEYPRLCIASAERSGPPCRFWNSTKKSWGPKNDATLFAALIEVANEIRQIQMTQYAGLPIRTFTVPIELDFYGDMEMDQETLVEWLRQAIRFTIDYGNFGNGPSPDTLVLPLLLWDQTQELGIETKE
jgi:hypothetical protein